METGGLVHIVTGKNIRLLHESTREVIEFPLLLSAVDILMMMTRSYMHMKTREAATMLSHLWIFGPGKRSRWHLMRSVGLEDRGDDDITWGSINFF